MSHAPDHSPLLRASGLSRTFPGVAQPAVADASFEVEAGEIFALIGPSGCGKTTTLRMIAGFEDTDSGSIELAGDDITRVEAEKRGVGIVFQDYALFPHLNVLDNVGFAIRDVGRRERNRRAGSFLDMVGLAGYGERFPDQLSGGQQQRVALARTFAARPRLILLDEPFSNLDSALRQATRREIRQLLKQNGVGAVFVTHDQEEALTLSDRIAVFNQGRVEQVGTPREVYEFPQTAFVAGFLGVSNLIAPDLAERLTGDSRAFTVRPERVRIASAESTPAPHETSVLGTISELVYTGPATRYIVEGEHGLRVIAERHNDHAPNDTAPWSRGDRVRVAWATEHAAVVP